jgi:cysteate synthase
MPSHYLLECPVCHERFEDTYNLSCPRGCPGLIRTVYESRQLRLRNESGIFRFADWLPINRVLPTRSGPVCYQSRGLSEKVGFSRLWIGFTGWFPEQDACSRSGSFKELEAWPTVARFMDRSSGAILVMSAGNTGRAFAEVSALTGQQVVVVVPEQAASRIWTSRNAPGVFLITVEGDYTDAIRFGEQLAASCKGLVPEGGAKNVARRDGMGTVVLEAARTIGTLPDVYVQAVGSGTGGIAAWEAALRLLGDGRFGGRLPRLFLVQNEPFIPMVRAWNAGRREILPVDMPDAENAIRSVYSDVLTNRSPPYGIPGGVFDALKATDGRMLSASVAEAKEAARLIRETEGVDPDPAAAVAAAGLIRALHDGLVGPDEIILLNITGGGYERIPAEVGIVTKPVDLTIKRGSPAEQACSDISRWGNPRA